MRRKATFHFIYVVRAKKLTRAISITGDLMFQLKALIIDKGKDTRKYQ